MTDSREASLPVTGAWREGMPTAFRQFADLGDFELESGFVLPNVRVAYETWGTFTGDNCVWLEHALTGDSHAAGPASDGQPTSGWWGHTMGPGEWLDTNEWFVVYANVVGGCQGSTGPSSIAPDGKAWGSRWPRITCRDQVRIEMALADYLGIPRFASIMGGSMGGMRALEWMIMAPERVQSALLVCTTAKASADQIGTQTAQIRAITNDPHWNGGDYYGQPVGPHLGMELARQIAHLTYRTENEFAVRFGSRFQDDEDPYGPRIAGRHDDAGRFAVQSYLDYHGKKLVRRFDAGTYIALTDTMTTHDVSRGRGTVADVLGNIECPVVVAGIDSDRLFPVYQQVELAEYIPNAEACEIIEAPYGHDSFLIANELVGLLVKKTLGFVR